MAPVDKKAKQAQKSALKGSHGHQARKVRTSVSFRRPKTLTLARNPKILRKAVNHLPRFDAYRVINAPVLSETAVRKVEVNNTLVLRVDVQANKYQIKDAVKKLYSVSPIKINTLIGPDGKKKAYVRLSPNDDALDVANRVGFL